MTTNKISDIIITEREGKRMENYDTYTFQHKSHYNEFAPDITMEFVTHQEEQLDRVLNFMKEFLIACGYSEKGIVEAMHEFEDY